MNPALAKMNIVIVGHVDHGKSTVVGRLLADTGSLPEGKLEQVKALCQKNAKPFEYAFLLDALQDERDQGITIDAARCFFKSQKREYIIIDAPGHIEFLKNMVSGAARAEAALLVIDAKEGIRENSRRHGYLLSMLGIKQVAICVNKMDLVNYSESVFKTIEKEYREFLKKIGLEPRCFIPIAALNGENLTDPAKSMPWYRGGTVLEVLDQFETAPDISTKPFRMPVQGIYKFTEDGDDRRIVAGRVESGTLSVGDAVIFYPSHKRSEVSSIESFNTEPKKSVKVGESVGVTLKEQIYIHRGEVMCRLEEPHTQISPLLRVRIFWMGRKPMNQGQEYKLKLGTAKVSVRIKEITRIFDASDLKKAEKAQIERHDVAECILEAYSPIAFDGAHDLEATGRFVIVDEYDIAGGGMVVEGVKDAQAEVRKQVARREMMWDFSIVDPKDRVAKYSHQSKLILLTGKIGVDKKVIAKKVEKTLFERGVKTYFLGMGNLLRGLDVDLDKQARREHVRRMAEVAHLLMDAGLIVLATASNLTDEELKLFQEVTLRESILIVNVGQNDFVEGLVDLQLPNPKTLDENADTVLKLLEASGVFSL